MDIVRKLALYLKKHNLTVAAAESCTGGFCSYLLTRLPGSSKFFKGGLVVYSLESKNKFFKIPPGELKKTQGVSGKTAIILASGARKKFKSDIGLSVVGFAGPEHPGKIPAGTVFIAFSSRKSSFAKRFLIKGTRETVRKKSARLAIQLACKTLKENTHASFYCS